MGDSATEGDQTGDFGWSGLLGVAAGLELALSGWLGESLLLFPLAFFFFLLPLFNARVCALLPLAFSLGSSVGFGVTVWPTWKFANLRSMDLSVLSISPILRSCLSNLASISGFWMISNSEGGDNNNFWGVGGQQQFLGGCGVMGGERPGPTRT